MNHLNKQEFTVLCGTVYIRMDRCTDGQKGKSELKMNANSVSGPLHHYEACCCPPSLSLSTPF